MRSFVHSRHSLLLLLLLLVCSSGLGLTTSLRGVARAVDTPHIWLSQKVAPPTASMQVNGGGFGSSETISVDFDTTRVVTTTTDATGKFAVGITVPKTALPGTHTVRATGQNSGLTAPTLFLVRTDWAQPGFGPYHTGHNPYENVLNLSNVSSLVRDWSYTGRGSFSSPVVVDGIVYTFSGGGTLYTLDAVTGALKWRYHLESSFSDSELLGVANGIIYVNVNNGKLYALDALTGVLKWRYGPRGGFLYTSPIVANGLVYDILDGGTLYALDAMNGTFKWSYVVEGMYSSPAVANGIVYVGGGSMLYALDALTGTFKWSYNTQSTDIEVTPVVANGVVYIGSLSAVGTLYALDALTGVLKWSYDTGGPIEVTPAVANGVVYVGSSLKLYALDALTGTFKWSYGLGAFVSCCSVVANGVVYISADLVLYALDALTGTLKWSYNVGGPQGLIVVNGVVYVGSANGNMYAFHLPSMS